MMVVPTWPGPDDEDPHGRIVHDPRGWHPGRGVIEAVVFDMDGRPARLRAGLGRRPRAARARARRPLARARPAGHDGHELARVVALHARRASGSPSRPPRSTPRSCAGWTSATARALPLIAGAVDAVRAPRRPLAARPRLVLEPPADRLALELAGLATALPGHGLLRGGGPRQAGPDVYLEAARRLGVEPARCAAVEDSTTASAPPRRPGCA